MSDFYYTDIECPYCGKETPLEYMDNTQNIEQCEYCHKRFQAIMTFLGYKIDGKE